jgi:hypothetical protein
MNSNDNMIQYLYYISLISNLLHEYSPRGSHGPCVDLRGHGQRNGQVGLMIWLVNMVFSWDLTMKFRKFHDIELMGLKYED